ncbi:hypothetical protein T12_9617 [Trichinella patagoniensis]|uniref:Uncharacterized protein n=1 Tax=Trichinella patagoniensis TaxID=990121 RepID=A0A0V0ZYG5_9BILA|nr:hypothetical protein T12_9617 [Trichinella patagoniensis]
MPQSTLFVFSCSVQCSVNNTRYVVNYNSALLYRL